MDILSIFYLVSIIFMVLLLVMLVGSLITLWVIKNKVSALQKDINDKVNAIKNIRIGKKIIAEDAGVLVAQITSKKKNQPNKKI